MSHLIAVEGIGFKQLSRIVQYFPGLPLQGLQRFLLWMHLDRNGRTLIGHFDNVVSKCEDLPAKQATRETKTSFLVLKSCHCGWHGTSSAKGSACINSHTGRSMKTKPCFPFVFFFHIFEDYLRVCVSRPTQVAHFALDAFDQRFHTRLSMLPATTSYRVRFFIPLEGLKQADDSETKSFSVEQRSTPNHRITWLMFFCCMLFFLVRVDYKVPRPSFRCKQKSKNTSTGKTRA